jgi:starvation-inducible DNA-binding protein
MDPANAEQVAQTLQQRLVALTDLHLTLKHIHWNVVGPNFIAVHEMLDPQVEAVRKMSDAVAERIATLGFEPIGTPGAIVKSRAWTTTASIERRPRSISLRSTSCTEVWWPTIGRDRGIRRA